MADRTIYLYDDIYYSNEYELNNGVNIDLVGKKHIKEINFDANDMESLCIALNNSDVEEDEWK